MKPIELPELPPLPVADCNEYYGQAPPEDAWYQPTVETYARTYAASCVAAALEEAAKEHGRLESEIAALMRDGPPMQRGKKGNGEVWMGTMRDVLNDYKQAAKVEADIADGLRATIRAMKAETKNPPQP